MDLMTIDFFWVRFYVAAVLDGFSRKLLELRVFRDAPTSMNIWRLVKTCITEFGAPRFLVTDHGCQFRTWFRRFVEKRGIALVKGRKLSRVLTIGRAATRPTNLARWRDAPPCLSGRLGGDMGTTLFVQAFEELPEIGVGLGRHAAAIPGEAGVRLAQQGVRLLLDTLLLGDLHRQLDRRQDERSLF